MNDDLPPIASRKLAPRELVVAVHRWVFGLMAVYGFTQAEARSVITEALDIMPEITPEEIAAERAAQEREEAALGNVVPFPDRGGV